MIVRSGKIIEMLNISDKSTISLINILLSNLLSHLFSKFIIVIYLIKIQEFSFEQDVVQFMTILKQTFDLSQFLKGVFCSKIEDSSFIFLNYSIIIIFNITGYHVILSSLKLLAIWTLPPLFKF